MVLLAVREECRLWPMLADPLRDQIHGRGGELFLGFGALNLLNVVIWLLW